jgi:hypothetical protein
VALAPVALALVPASGHAPSAARAAASAPAVQSMIVGLGGRVLQAARSVSAAPATLRVGGRSCAVAAATPLAVLIADRRAGGPGFAVRDYGHCGPAPGGSGSLFVYSLGGESNRGQSGWEYKVEGVSGSTGAADPSGPMGDGRRLRAGERVLWFWCEASAGGCQRTLELSPTSATVAPGSSLTVSVYGADNEGRLSYAPGASVSLGSRVVSAGAYGHATVLAPASPGRYALSATRRGLVPAFPATIVVR